DHATQLIRRLVGLPGDRVQGIKRRLSPNSEPVAMEPVAGAVAGRRKIAPADPYRAPPTGAASYRIMKADGGHGPAANTPRIRRAGREPVRPLRQPRQRN